MQGETLRTDYAVCIDCKAHMDLRVGWSGGGWYIGYWCPNCGPYSRESGYYQSREAAEWALEDCRYGR